MESKNANQPQENQVSFVIFLERRNKKINGSGE